MQYRKTVPGVFLDRPNRFIAHVLIGDRTETVHVKNTGRCRELLQPGVRVWLSESDNPTRKTKYDLVAVEKRRPDRTDLLVNMDSQIPNDAAEEWLRSGHFCSAGAEIRREVFYGDSRFDFMIREGKRTVLLEVKGVTLEENGVAAFPDAPTTRGAKHLRELIKAREEGLEAWVLFVVQMQEMEYLRPCDEHDPEFGKALRQAVQAGVRLLAVDCEVTPDALRLSKPVPIRL